MSVSMGRRYAGHLLIEAAIDREDNTTLGPDNTTLGPDNTVQLTDTRPARHDSVGGPDLQPNISTMPTMVNATISARRGSCRRTANPGSMPRRAMSWVTSAADT